MLTTCSMLSTSLNRHSPPCLLQISSKFSCEENHLTKATLTTKTRHQLKVARVRCRDWLLIAHLRSRDLKFPMHIKIYRFFVQIFYKIRSILIITRHISLFSHLWPHDLVRCFYSTLLYTFRCPSKASSSITSSYIPSRLKRRGQKVHSARETPVLLFLNRHDRSSYRAFKSAAPPRNRQTYLNSFSVLPWTLLGLEGFNPT